jgi:anaerobic selenocysteine-containing dehydrogenase
MAMYHSWGSQNAWLRQILGRNWLYMNRGRARDLGLVDGEWVKVTSPHGTITGPLKLMDGTNADTVWTWNAIGKRAGAWNLDATVPEARKGFLLNHLIGELLPEREGGYRYANADPVTGQAAWYDLRVRVEKASAGRGLSLPRFPRLKRFVSLLPRPTSIPSPILGEGKGRGA